MKLHIQILDDRLLNGDSMYATPGAAGADLRACLQEPLHLHPGEVRLIPLGFAMALPTGTAAMLLPRSGLGHKEGIVLGNLTGLIDEDYRGQVFASVWNRNRGGMPFTINPMDRIAQMVIVPALRPEFELVDELPKTERGAGGFGSTGVGG